MEMKEFKAASVDEAITEASLSFGVPSTELVYEVVEEGSNGFLGFGKKQALIKARIKTESDVLVEEAAKTADKSLEEKKKPKFTMEVKDDQVKVDTFNNNKTSIQKKEEKKVEKKAATAPAAKKEEPKKKEEAVKVEKTERPEKQERVIVNPERVIVNPDNIDTILEETKKFLNDVFAAMKIETEVAITFDKEKNDVNIELSGDEMGVLIGKRGNTLDSLQYLTSLYCNKLSNQYLRVKMDTENYRARRKQTLEHLAKNIAYKVKKTKRPVYLEPMNPYERRIIHSALQNDRFVTTKSEGEEPYRKVVVILKK